MKLKVLKLEEVETDYELPLYLYCQGEFFEEEYIKITDKEKITIKTDYYTFSISVETNFKVHDMNFEKNVITEELFNEMLEWAISVLKQKNEKK